MTVQVSAYQSGVSLVVDKAERVTVVSLLLQTQDRGELLAGVWECRPEMAPPAAILLHVIKGNRHNRHIVFYMKYSVAATGQTMYN